MTTDRDLDLLLAEARGIRDEDLPVLPERFLRDLPTLDAAEPASVLAARQLVDDAHVARTAPRRRRPSRRLMVRAGAAVLVVAASWTTAVVVTSEDGERTQQAVPTPGPAAPTAPTAPMSQPPLDPSGGLTLVAAEAITFPYSVDPAPAGLTPVVSRLGGLTPFGTQSASWGAGYRSAQDPGFAFAVTATDPRIPQPGVHEAGPGPIAESGTTSVAGMPADFDRGRYESPHCSAVPATLDRTKALRKVCSDVFTELWWQRADGRWVHLLGEGNTYTAVPALVRVAESIVDRPQPVPLQLGLAPEGWSVSSYESFSTSGSNLSLVSDADPSSRNQVSVSMWGRWDQDYQVGYLRNLAEGNPVEQATVQGAPAELTSVPDHFADAGSGLRTWYVIGQVPHGPVFLLQAPDSLSRDDVLAMAEQVTYTP